MARSGRPRTTPCCLLQALHNRPDRRSSLTARDLTGRRARTWPASDAIAPNDQGRAFGVAGQPAVPDTRRRVPDRDYRIGNDGPFPSGPRCLEVGVMPARYRARSPRAGRLGDAMHDDGPTYSECRIRPAPSERVAVRHIEDAVGASDPPRESDIASRSAIRSAYGITSRMRRWSACRLVSDAQVSVIALRASARTRERHRSHAASVGAPRGFRFEVARIRS